MKTFIRNLAVVWILATAPAMAATTLYYSGEAVTTSGEVVDRHPYLVARTSDSVAGTISEAAVSYQQGGYKENFSTIHITGNQFTMSESTGLVTGSGELTGEPWNWTFLRGEFRVAKYGMRIVDFNFFADPAVIMGHKDFYVGSGADEKLFMQEDVALHLTDAATYAARRAELLK